MQWSTRHPVFGPASSPSWRTVWARVAFWCWTGFIATYAVFVLTVPGQWADAQLLGRSQVFAPGGWWIAWSDAGRLVFPVVGLAVFAWRLLVMTARRNGRAVAAALLTVLASVGGARLLRTRVLWRPDLGPHAYPYNTLPSTHAAIIASTVAAVFILSPYAWRLWRLVGAAAFVVIGCLGNVVSLAHRPSDTLASVFLSVAVAATCVAVSGTNVRPGWSRPPRVPRHSDPR